MMANKNGAEKLANAAYTAKAVKSIAKAFMSGGWQAALLETVKRYWPQILVATLVLFILPIVAFYSLPAVYLGYNNSKNAEIISRNIKIDEIKGYYDKYSEYCNNRIEDIIKANDYETVIAGNLMDKNWFVALYSVSTGNDLVTMSEQSIIDFVAKSIVYTIEFVPNDAEDGEDSVVQILKIQYLTPLEFMSVYGFSNADINWAQLMYQTIDGNNVSCGGVLGSPFSISNWRTNITSEYGYRTSPQTGFHTGLDIGMEKGTDILAVKEGIVKTAINGTEGYGKHIVIDHGNGLETLYAHCDELLVYEGQKIEAGAVIAKVGSTGNSTGPHLHIEIRLNGKTLDPFAYLS